MESLNLNDDFIEYGGGRAGAHELDFLKAGYGLDEIDSLRQELLSQNDQEFTEFVEDINSGDSSLIVATLEDLRDYPSADERVLPYLERLLDDKTPCLLAIPYIFGEIRWLAAKALLAEREALGIREPVRVQNVVRPIDTRGVMRAANAANIEIRGEVEGVLETLAIARDMGHVPMSDLILYPQPRTQADARFVAPPALMPVPALA